MEFYFEDFFDVDNDVVLKKKAILFFFENRLCMCNCSTKFLKHIKICINSELKTRRKKLWR